MNKARAGKAPFEANYKAIWTDLTVADWKAFLEENSAGSSWQLRGGSLLGNCPFPGHADTTPSCWLKPKQGFIKCFGCGQFESNPIRFVTNVTNKSWGQTFTELRKRYNIRVPAKYAEALQKRETDQIIKREIANAMNEALIFAVEALQKDASDPTFQFAQKCVNYLIHRKIPLIKAQLKNLPIGILPPLIMLKALVKDNFESCVKYLQNWLTAEYVGSLAFVYHSAPGEISDMRLRADFLRPNKRKDIIRISGEEKYAASFFGLDYYTVLLGQSSKDTPTEALIVEGEFDALSNMVNQMKDGKPYDVVLATGGSAETSLDHLSGFGIDCCLLVPDAPDHGGDVIAQNLLRNNTSPMQIFSWPSAILAKDPDDAIKTHGWQLWLKHVMSREADGKKRAHFDYPHKWALTKLKEKLVDVDPDDVRSLKELAGNLGTCLTASAEQRAYINEATKITSLSASEITEIIVGREETEEGYIKRILQALKEQYLFLGLDTNASGTRVYMWHKKKREMRSWNISRPSEMFGILGADLGGMIFWARNYVGIPDWLLYKRTAKGSMPVGLLEQETVQKKYLQMAVDELLKELPNLDRLQELKAGCHYIDLSTSGGAQKHWAVVNGNDVYLGTFKAANALLDWRRLDGPQIGSYYFNLVRPSWSAELKTANDLVDGLSADIEETFDFLVAIINRGWKLRNQYEDSEYLAAAIMVNPVSSAMPRQLYTIINGSRGSGKSNFLGLISGTHPETRVLETAFAMDSYTVAGFRKEMNNCALGAVLDEFEDTGNDNHSRHVREILRDVRGLTSNPECRILRGNTENSEATEYVLKCQLWTASIQYLRDEADISRFVQIHTELEEGRPSPTVTLKEIFSSRDFMKHRRTISLGMFKYAPKLLDVVAQLRAMYGSPKAMKALSDYAGTEIPSRFLDGVVIPAALIQLVGRNPHNFIRRFIKAKAPYLKRVVQTTHKHTLLDHILSAQIEYKRPNSEVRHTTIRTLLGDATERYLLNNADSGVQYIEFIPKSSPKGAMRHWLVVIWSDALHGVLRGVSTYRYETAARLKQLADSDHTMTVPQRAVKEVPGGIRQHLKVGIKSADYTIYDVTEMLGEWDTLSQH